MYVAVLAARAAELPRAPVPLHHESAIDPPGIDLFATREMARTIYGPAAEGELEMQTRDSCRPGACRLPTVPIRKKWTVYASTKEEEKVTTRLPRDNRCIRDAAPLLCWSLDESDLGVRKSSSHHFRRKTRAYLRPYFVFYDTMSISDTQE